MGIQKDFRLSDVQMCILDIITSSPQQEWTTGQIGASKRLTIDMILDMMDHKGMCSSRRTRYLFIANRLGVILAGLARKGFLIRRDNPQGRPGHRSFWKLGPMTDAYRDEVGI